MSEVLPNGTGSPDQAVQLAHTQILPDAMTLSVGDEAWTRVDDLFAAGPEVPVPDLRLSARRDAAAAAERTGLHRRCRHGHHPRSATGCTACGRPQARGSARTTRTAAAAPGTSAPARSHRARRCLPA